MRQRGLGAAIVVTLVFALPSAASGATLCVNKIGPECEQLFAAAQLGAAISKANENQASFDEILIGPGVYDGGPYNASSNVDIRGAGREATVITNAAPMGFADIVLLANFEGQAITDLTVRIGAGESSEGLQVGGGALVERVRVDAAAGATPSTGIDAFGVTMRNVIVQLPRQSFSTAMAGAGAIEDSTFEGQIGLFLGGGVAKRILAAGNTAVAARDARVEDSLLRASGPDAVGLALGQFDAGEVALSHVTVTGDSSPGSIGVKAEKGSGAFASLTSTLTVRNTVVAGFATALTHRGYAGGGTTSCGTDCQIAQVTDVAYSALDFPEGIVNFGGPGSLTLGAGNVDLGDPRFADPAAGDFRLRYDSPLIDAGEPLPLGAGSFYSGESPVDLGGLERIVDGRPGGDPAAQRDIGAYEYARRSPSLKVGTPAEALLYRPVSIPVEASDPDPFDLLTFSFAFDGTDAAGQGTHVFTTLGPHTASVVVSDPTGAAATGSTAFDVKARPGKCANLRAGGPGRDSFKGTGAGEKLLGGAGKDTLRGLGGRDCLFGGAGDDGIDGGKGGDRLDGGKGQDRIVSRDGKRDRVDCGPGHDTALADAKDKLRRCEKVRRR